MSIWVGKETDLHSWRLSDVALPLACPIYVGCFGSAAEVPILIIQPPSEADAGCNSCLITFRHNMRGYVISL